MTSVTVLGLGPMGHALASALSSQHPTTVWSRTPGRADDLDAEVADTAPLAIAASPLVVVCVRDQEVTRAVLDPAFLPGRTVLSFSGGTPEEARDLAAWVRSHRGEYVDGVVVATPEAIGTAEAAFYLSGPKAAVEQHAPTLLALGENLQHLGEDPGRGAALDAALQDMLWTSMSGVVHMLALARAEGLSIGQVAEQATALLGFFPDFVGALAEQVATASYPGDLGTLDSTAGVMDHVLRTIRANDLDDAVLSASREQVQRAIDAGHGDDGFGRLADTLSTVVRR